MRSKRMGRRELLMKGGAVAVATAGASVEERDAAGSRERQGHGNQRNEARHAA